MIYCRSATARFLGTALKVDGVTEGPVDRLRVREMVARARILR